MSTSEFSASASSVEGVSMGLGSASKYSFQIPKYQIPLQDRNNYIPPSFYQSTLLSVQSSIIHHLSFAHPSLHHSSLPPTLPPSRRSVNFSTDGGSRTENRALVSVQFLERTQHLLECPVGGSSAAAHTPNSRKEEERYSSSYSVFVF